MYIFSIDAILGSVPSISSEVLVLATLNQCRCCLANLITNSWQDGLEQPKKSDQCRSTVTFFLVMTAV